MKIFAISDLHMSINSNKPMNIFGPVWENYLDDIVADWQKKVSAEDVVIIAGDISWAMKLEDAKADLDWIAALPSKKVFIRGNHDYWWKSPSSIRAILKDDMYLIQNDSLKLGKFVFCGTRGWSVPENEFYQSAEDKKIFDREVLRLELSLQSAQKQKTNEDEQILALIHYPPFNSRLEDSAFTKLFEQYGVSEVIYGHLHGKDARAVLKHTKNGVTYHLTSCDLLGNKLVEIA